MVKFTDKQKAIFLFSLVLSLSLSILLGIGLGFVFQDQLSKIDFQNMKKTKAQCVQLYDQCVQWYNNLRGTCSMEKQVPKLNNTLNWSFKDVSMD